MTDQPGAATVAVDGRHAFDFFEGTWKAPSRRRMKPLDPTGTEWVSFDAEIVSKSILHGMGSIDITRIPDMPGRGEFEGFTLRLLNPDTGLWRIWWASTVSKGELDVPVVGRFHDERNGIFECDDVVEDQSVKIRYTWRIDSPTAINWTQAYSFDDGVTWDTNWVVDATRVS